MFPLVGNQLDAANPRDNVWLSASAGTGKTQVLSARVLRLLLRRDVQPDAILCLTFTKAGAAEMANRINDVLARWVRLDDTTLGKELGYLGADYGPADRERARTLFASVLDCPGGGLRIDTIHAFSQWLIANFPEEAGLSPGARPMEDRERELLAREVLSGLVSDAEKSGDTQFINAISQFVREKEPDALRAWLMRCASAADLWQGKTGWQSPMRNRVLRLLDMPNNADARWAASVLDPEVFPDHQLQAMLPTLEAWDTKNGRESSAFIAAWLSLDLADRCEAVGQFNKTLLKADGAPRQMKKPSEADPQFPDRQAEIADAVAQFHERQALLELADFLTSALEIGRRFSIAWEAAKQREGLLDFDDLIRKAATLIGNTDAASWIRYKLDRSFDHILIDEAQDTNEAQWDIVFALIDDFFSGDGASGDRLRTIFTVGDYKQAIFGFQGTSPENFARAKEKVRSLIEATRQYAHELRESRRLPTWNDLDLGRSFRTSKPVLDFVNAALDAIGPSAFGLVDTPEPHVGAVRPGLVTLWNPVTSVAGDNGEDDDEQDWLPAHDTVLADRIAEQVRQWVSLEQPFVLEKGERRHAGPGDIMVLVRKRKELASQIVAKLHAKGVPVAGVDRLRLGAPLAVKDLMAALRFAAQPLDDLSLANLLSSPLIGWTQDDILAHVPRGPKIRLWDHLRRHDNAFVVETANKLRELLARADFETPQALLSWLLTGPWQARGNLVARLGREANDPIDELVNAAFAYEAAQTPSLAGFIEWFDAGQSELKREAGEASGLVRVMTVHGSKGLQAPIVILADATGEPGKGGSLDLLDDPVGNAEDPDRPARVPLPQVSKAKRVGAVSHAAEKAATEEMQEHWRLLYVAMTRAEEALFITGSLGPRQVKKGVPSDSWYAQLQPVFAEDAFEDPIWGARREWGERAEPLYSDDTQAKPDSGLQLPEWATRPIGPEPRPPKPLAPSSAGEEKGADPPLDAGLAVNAAQRGTLIHRLLERLPDIDPSEREGQAHAWLERQAADLLPDAREEMAQSAIKVLDHPGYERIFGPDALAEVPIAAEVGGVVIAGSIDRLLVEPEQVTVIDFKTTRRPPDSLNAVPPSTLSQMAAYVAALETVYPERRIRAAVLYTHAPQLIEIPDEMIALHKDRLGAAQESYAPAYIE